VPTVLRNFLIKLWETLCLSYKFLCTLYYSRTQQFWPLFSYMTMIIIRWNFLWRRQYIFILCNHDKWDVMNVMNLVRRKIFIDYIWRAIDKLTCYCSANLFIYEHYKWSNMCFADVSDVVSIFSDTNWKCKRIG